MGRIATLPRMALALAAVVAVALPASRAPARADDVPQFGNGDVIAAMDVYRGAGAGRDIVLRDLTRAKDIPLSAGLNTSADEHDPRISEDGSRLLFERTKRNRTRVHLFDLRAGREITPAVLSGVPASRGAGLSPDGTVVVVGRRTVTARGESGVPALSRVDVTSGSLGLVVGRKTYDAPEPAQGTYKPAVAVAGNGHPELVGYEVRIIDAHCDQPFEFDGTGTVGFTQLVSRGRTTTDGFTDGSCSGNGVIDLGIPSFGEPAIASNGRIALTARARSGGQPRSDDIWVIDPTQSLHSFTASASSLGSLSATWLDFGLTRTGAGRPSSAPAGVNSSLQEHSPTLAAGGRFLGYVRTKLVGDTPLRQYLEVYDYAAGRRLRLGTTTFGARIDNSVESISIAQDPTRTSIPPQDGPDHPPIPDRVPSAG
jgi:WD40 repeat protein